MSEKSLTDIPRELRALYRKGQDAMQRENFDYAIALFSQVLDSEPACVEIRQALRAAQIKKAAGSGGGFFKKVFTSASASPLLAKGQLALRRSPAEALHIAEQVLNSDPHSSAAHKLLAEAALAAELPRTAVLSFELLAKNAPKDKHLNMQFAEALLPADDPVRAEKVLAELSRAYPLDNEIAQKLKNISASKTMSEGGYQTLAAGEGSYRDILKDKEEAIALEQEKRSLKTEDVAERLIGEYETRLKGEPNNLKMMRSLAELYTQKKQFDRAIRLYEQIKASAESGSDPGLDRAIADTVVRRFEHDLEQLDPGAPDYAEKAAGLQQEKRAYQLAECQKRVERFPTDLQIRFEMGQLYFQADMISEAIQEFQKAQVNPHRRIQAMNYLGQCFARRNMNDLAIRTLQNGIKEKVIFDDEKKDLIYNLGCVLEKMGRREEAVKQFELIYEVDIGYRDVAAKVDAFYAAE